MAPAGMAIILRGVFSKNASFKVMVSFACLECHELLLSHKIRIPMEPTQRGYDITNRD